jgi:predicted PurR-regulated permease PerM
MAATSSKGDSVAGGGVGAAIVGAIIVGLIYFGRDLLIPIALAILLSFVLAPIVRTLQKWHVPHGVSTVTVVLLAFLTMFAIGGTIAAQVTQLAADLPRYQTTIRAKIDSLRARSAASGPLEQAHFPRSYSGRPVFHRHERCRHPLRTGSGSPACRNARRPWRSR